MDTLVVKPGTLNTLVFIEKPMRTTGSRGEIITTWVPHIKALGGVEFGYMGEDNESYGRATEQAVTVSMRYRKSFDSTYRMVIEGTPYYIKNMRPEGKKQWLIIEATSKNG